MLLELSQTLHSDAFAQSARHPDFPRAFTRRRQLPLPALVATLLCMRASSQQCLLDSVFGAMRDTAAMVRGVSDRAFAKARSHLHMPALLGLNDQVLAHAERAGMVPRWQGLRLVAADASVLMPAIRRCKRTQHLAAADQRLFALYLPGAELTVHAAVHSACESERAMLANALDKLSPADVLLLDRGYPAAWLVNLLNERGLKFVIRCDTTSGGWRSLRQFMRSDQDEADIVLKAPKAQDAADWNCSAQAPTVRVVRSIAPNGQIRVLMTNLSAQQAPAAAFGALYHRRWRIEEAFKRLKWRLKLETVSGLSQHAVLVDVAAKVLADNLCALMCAAAHANAIASADKRCAPTSALNILQRALPRLLLAAGCLPTLLGETLAMIARSLKRPQTGRTTPRTDVRSKPHPNLAYKG